MKNILIVGATSVLAVETAKLFARDGARFVLVARNPEKLDRVADELRKLGADVHPMVMDVREVTRCEAVVQEAWDKWGGLDLALVAHAVAHDQKACERDLALVCDQVQVSLTSTLCFLTALAGHFERQRSGTLAAISSVSGDRGRRGQYLYASCKAGLTVFMQGLRQRLHRSGVSVVTLKPGLTDTPLTAPLKAMKRGLLFSSPERVARGMHRAIERREDEAYVPRHWRLVMFVIRAIPEAIFKRWTLDN